MGQGPSGMPGGDNINKKKDDKKRKNQSTNHQWNQSLVKEKKAPIQQLNYLVYPNTRCKLKLLKLERIKDHLLLEEEFVANQEAFQPTEAKTSRRKRKVDELRGYPMAIGTLEEIIDDDHAIVSSTASSEYYVSIMSFVDKGLLEPGCSVLYITKQ